MVSMARRSVRIERLEVAEVVNEPEVDDAFGLCRARLKAGGVVQIAAKNLGPDAARAFAEASERASPRTRWPAETSSGTTAEPMKPDAPVTKTRMGISFRDRRCQSLTFDLARDVSDCNRVMAATDVG